MSEGETEDITDAPLAACGKIEVVQTAHHIDVQQFENVVDAKHQFHIRMVVVHDVAAFGDICKFVG